MNQSLAILSVVLMSAAFSHPPVTVGQPVRDVHSVIQCYSDSLKELDGGCVIESEVWQEIEDEDGSVEYSFRVIEYATDGDRVRWTITEWNDLTSEVIPPDVEGDRRQGLWDGSVWYNYFHAGKQPLGKLSIRRTVDEREEWKNRVDGERPLKGILLGDIDPLPVVVRTARNATLRDRPDVIDGASCTVLDAEGTSGKYQLWFDVSRGCWLKKATVLKQGDDLLYGAPTSAPPPPLPKGMRLPPGITRKAVKSYSFKLYDVVTQQIEGRWLPVEAKCETVVTFEDGSVRKTLTRIKRTRIDPTPDFAASGGIVPDFPDGTPTTNRDALGIPHFWEAGRAVPRINEDVIRRIDQSIEEVRNAPKD